MPSTALLMDLPLPLLWGVAMLGATVCALLLARGRKGAVRRRWLAVTAVLVVVGAVAAGGRGMAGDWWLAVFTVVDVAVVAVPFSLEYLDGVRG